MRDRSKYLLQDGPYNEIIYDIPQSNFGVYSVPAILTVTSVAKKCQCKKKLKVQGQLYDLQCWYLIFPWWHFNILRVLSTCLHHHHHLLLSLSLCERARVRAPWKMFLWIFVRICSVSKTLNEMVTLQSIRELPRQQTHKNTTVITWGQCTYCYNLCCYASFYWGNFKHTWVRCTYEHFFFKLLF